MWYNALIPLGIITVFISIPAYISPFINKLVTGNRSGRFYKSTIEYMAYARDYELAGNQLWKLNGLEVIPDK